MRATSLALEYLIDILLHACWINLLLLIINLFLHMHIGGHGGEGV